MWDKISQIRTRGDHLVQNIKPVNILGGMAAGKLAKLAYLFTNQAEKNTPYHVLPEVAEIVGFSVGLFASYQLNPVDDSGPSAPPVSAS